MDLLKKQLCNLREEDVRITKRISVCLWGGESSDIEKTKKSLEYQINQNFSLFICSDMEDENFGACLNGESDYIVFVNAGTYLFPHALFEIAKIQADTDAIALYADSCCYDFVHKKTEKYFLNPPFSAGISDTAILVKKMICWKRDFVCEQAGNANNRDILSLLCTMAEHICDDNLVTHVSKILYENKEELSVRIDCDNADLPEGTVSIIIMENSRKQAEKLKRRLSAWENVKVGVAKENQISSELGMMLRDMDTEYCLCVSDECVNLLYEQMMQLIGKIAGETNVAASALNISTEQEVLYAGATVDGTSLYTSFWEGALLQDTEIDGNVVGCRKIMYLSEYLFAVKRSVLEHTINTGVEVDSFRGLAIKLSLDILKNGKNCLYSGDVCLEFDARKKKTTRLYKDFLDSYGSFLSDDRFCSDDMKSSISEESGRNRIFSGPKNALKEKKSLLVFSHELTLTGAPIVLMQAIKEFLANDFGVTVVSASDGLLREQLQKMGVAVIIDAAIKTSDRWISLAESYDLAIVNTAVLYRVVDGLGGKDIPVLWWIHEAKEEYAYLDRELPEVLSPNVKVFCVGHYAQALLNQSRPKYETDVLLYGIEDMLSTPVQEKYLLDRQNKIIFAHIGTLQKRKGQDILTRAIRLLPDEIREKSMFLFVGKPFDKDIVSSVQAAQKSYPDNVKYIGEVSRGVIRALYPQIDCTVCSSTDDPMPTFVTEGSMFSIPTICSANTGTAAWVERYAMGYCYNDNDERELAKEITRFVTERDNISELAHNSRQMYEEQFSMPVFRRHIIKTIQDMLEMANRKKRGLFYNDARLRREYLKDDIKKEDIVKINHSISVVIPTFNAGEEFEILLRSLKRQKGIEALEIVIIDSGSEDETLKLAEQYGCRIIRITQEQFSHSFARNLGAQEAKGEYILFMTQDALPESDVWMWKMFQQIQKNPEIVAVSCAEMPKLNADLYGAACSWYHMVFMGILNKDKVMFMPKTKNYIDIRKNSNLNDVACLVDKAVFEKFGYRHSFAEDLDLGKRLIEAGYRTALLGKTRVIHSHNRPEFYHLKRTFVERKAFCKIFPDSAYSSLTEEEFVNGSCWLYETVVSQTGVIAQMPLQVGIKEFINMTRKNIEEYEWNADRCADNITQPDASFIQFMEMLYAKLPPSGLSASTDVKRMFYADYKGQVNHSLDYLQSHAYSIGKRERDLLIKAMLSSMACAIGGKLGEAYLQSKKTSGLAELYQISSRGV